MKAIKRVKRISNLEYSILFDTDSYKFSHWKQYRKGVCRMISYLESRGGKFNDCTLFGLQYLAHKYLSKKITKRQVEEARIFAAKHGLPFNYDGWMYVVERYKGKLPVVIRAIPEGMVVPVKNAILTIECDDEKCFWVASWLETMLVRLWYPSTIAMNSRESKKIIKKYLDMSSDTPESILFKLHCFASRGLTVQEQHIGTAAHLLSFLGSDTVGGIRLANHYYHCDMAGFSITASEHSTVSMNGPEGEHEFFFRYVQENLVEMPTIPGVPKLAACVSDTYNIFEACKVWASERMLKLIKLSDGTVVIRPDSGPPVETLSEIFDTLEAALGDKVYLNSKGYKMLPNELRVIQGDGIDREMIEKILYHLVVEKGWSAENIAFGSGGGLLQKFDRDTQKWAFKCSAAWLKDGTQIDVRKNPITDQGKQSKAGRLDLVKRNGVFETIAVPDGQDYPSDSVMNIVFSYGDIYYDTNMDECRERMAI